jgi:hypothetical protein
MKKINFPKAEDQFVLDPIFEKRCMNLVGNNEPNPEREITDLEYLMAAFVMQHKALTNDIKLINEQFTSLFEGGAFTMESISSIKKDMNVVKELLETNKLLFAYVKDNNNALKSFRESISTINDHNRSIEMLKEEIKQLRAIIKS